MTLDQIDSLDTSSSILFLGSGFSMGATNQKGLSPPNGRQLRRWLETSLGFDSPTDYDLRVLADEMINRSPEVFSRELKDTFRITRLDPDQDKILANSWRRIYTTNYDDCVEFSRRTQRQPINSYDVGDEFPSKLSNGSIIHLHGSVRLIQPDNLKQSIVLGERSYVDQILHDSRWYDQFVRDIAFSDYVFFLGYSLSDYLISSLLNSESERRRTHDLYSKGSYPGNRAQPSRAVR